MKKEIYRYLTYSLAIALTGLAALYLLGSSLMNIFQDFNFQKRTGIPLSDTVKVIHLNKTAFKSRLTDPKYTIELAEQALKLAEKLDYLPGLAEAYRVSGVGFSYLENNPLATKNYIQALQYYKILKDEKNVARTYSNIGNLYKYIDPEKALNYFDKALKISEEIQNEELTAGIYFNMALICSRKKEYNKSLMYFDKSYGIFNQLKDTVSKVVYLQNTGRVYYYLGKIDSAKTRLFKAIKEGKENRLFATVSGCYLSLAYVYMNENKFKLARASINEGFKYASKLKSPDLNNDFVRIRYELELKQKNYQKAVEYLALAYRNDSLRLKENLSSNIDINVRHFQQQQKIQENELVIADQKYRETKTRWIITLCVLAAVLVVTFILVWYFIREKKRERLEIVNQNKINSLEQKALQAMMNPHFVFNVMNSIQHFINKADTRKANKVLSSFSRLARKHLEVCMSSTISLHDEILYLGLYLSFEKIRYLDKMNYKIRVDKEIDTEEVIIPAMLIQPFLENSIWHGIMPKEDGGTIIIDFEMEEDDLIITILDDGIGILNSESQKKAGHISRGMTLIRDRINLMNTLNSRHIHINQQQTGDHGTEVVIKIPT